MNSIFDTIAGLPIHPLVVHAVVILLPLSAVGLLACLVRPAWRERFGILVVIGALAGAGAGWVAAQSGDQLATRIGRPRDHAEWGERLVPVAIAFGVVTLLWYAVARRPQSGAGLDRVLGVIGALLAVGVLALTVVVGHSGATAAWAGKTGTSGGTATPAAGGSSTSPSASGSGTTSSSPSSSASAGALTLATVKTHNTESDCWAAINGQVYNLTTWVGQHPGGPQPIIGLCGTDATSAFQAQHGNQPEPNDRLAQFLVGPLAG